MESRAKLFGHPIHQMLIVFPLGLLATALLFDVAYLSTSNGYWTEIGFWMIVAGLAGGLVAAPFGLIDWLAIPTGTRAKRVGAWHGLGNLIVVALYALSAWVRMDLPDQPETAALLLSFAGGGLALVTGWLGGELVDRHAVGVHPGANLDAPSSLRATSMRG